MLHMIFSIGTLISLLIFVYGVYLSISYSLTSETATDHVDDLTAPKIINLSEASRNRRTDFTIGFRYHPAPTNRKAA